jgi:cysteine desulfurase / selenocysteine lyase
MYYLDNAATSWPKPDVVYQTQDNTFRQLSSPKRGTSNASRQGSEKLFEARQTLARLFNIADPMRVSFTGGCTHALNIAIQAFPWQAGDGVIMSSVEHHAVSRPIRKMAREKGIRFHVVPYSDETPFDLAHYEQLLKTDGKIRLVATTHASNVIGSVLPVAEISRLAHEHGALYLLDAAQSAGVLPVDVKALGVDMMALPGHKSLYGPPGVGALYIDQKVSLNTFLEGGTGNDSGKHEMSGTPPEGVEVGTIALPPILAFAAGANWVMETGIDKIHHHEMQLLTLLLEKLQALPELKVYGHTRVADKTPVVSFNLPGTDPKELGNALFDEYGVALRAGYHCAPMAHEAIGTLDCKGTVRASIGYFTRPEDIEALSKSLKTEILKRKAPALTP